jgi:hypothetical protein
MAERTGCPVLTDLWSYVPIFFYSRIQKLNFLLGGEPRDFGSSKTPNSNNQVEPTHMPTPTPNIQERQTPKTYRRRRQAETQLCVRHNLDVRCSEATLSLLILRGGELYKTLPRAHRIPIAKGDRNERGQMVPTA